MNILLEYIEKNDALFDEREFAEASPRIATKFNKFLGKNVFSDTDFMPTASDYPTGRDVTTDSSALALCRALGVDIQKAYPNARRRRELLTIAEYIDRVYLRVAKKAFPDTNTSGESHGSPTLGGVSVGDAALVATTLDQQPAEANSAAKGAQSLREDRTTEPQPIPNLEGVWVGRVWQEPDTEENTNCVYTIKLEQDKTNATGQAIIECIDPNKGKVTGEFEITMTISSDGIYYKDLYISKNSHPSDSGSWCVKEGKLHYDSRKNRLYGATQGYALVYGVKTPCRTIPFDLYRKQ